MTSTLTVVPADRWEERRVAAALLRAGLLLAPLAASSVALWIIVLLWPPPAGSRIGWLAVMCAAGFVIGVIAERGCRRFLPLVSLLRLTMLFPDKAPSRFKLARAAGNTKSLLERLARHPDDTAQQAAEKVLTLVTALGKHDSHTRGHSERVRLFADMLARELAMDPADRDRLRWASLLHDIGKLEIAPAILNKPAALNQHEFARIRQHPVIGAELAAPLLPWLGEWGHGIVDHHERWDGSGYPNGRKGHEISRAGRIICLVDAFETMTAARSYKKAQSTRAARAELVDCAGSQFDPTYVRAFLDISLPRLIWMMGPLSFLVQLPFLRGLAQVGAHVSTVPMQAAAATTVGVAAAGAAVLPLAVHADSLASRQSALRPAVGEQHRQLAPGVAGGADGAATGTTSPTDLPAGLGRRPGRHPGAHGPRQNAGNAHRHHPAHPAHGNAHAERPAGASGRGNGNAPQPAAHGPQPVKSLPAASPPSAPPGNGGANGGTSGGTSGSGAGHGQGQGQSNGPDSAPRGSGAQDER